VFVDLCWKLSRHTTLKHMHGVIILLQGGIMKIPNYKLEMLSLTMHSLFLHFRPTSAINVKDVLFCKIKHNYSLSFLNSSFVTSRTFAGKQMSLLRTTMHDAVIRLSVVNLNRIKLSRRVARYPAPQPVVCCATTPLSYTQPCILNKCCLRSYGHWQGSMAPES
jgi:hypothetical protein